MWILPNATCRDTVWPAAVQETVRRSQTIRMRSHARVPIVSGKNCVGGKAGRLPGQSEGASLNMKNGTERSMMQTSFKPIRDSFATDAIAALFIALALLTACTRSNASTDDVVEAAVRSALPNEKDIKFDGLYETTPDLHGSSETPNYNRRFTCGYVTYRNEAGKSIRARFIYLSHSDDPSQTGQNFLSVEKPEIDYGIRDEENGGKYVTSFELTGWNRSCADAGHPKTFSGVAPESIE